MTPFAAPAIACLVVAITAEPLRVYGVLAEYCPDDDVVEFEVVNALGVMLISSVSVERLDASGEWVEFSSDVLGTKPYAREVFAFRLAPNGARRISWRPRVSSNEGVWLAGRYRLVAYVMFGGRPPSKRSVLAEFVVQSGSGCPGNRNGAISPPEAPRVQAPAREEPAKPPSPRKPPPERSGASPKPPPEVPARDKPPPDGETK